MDASKVYLTQTDTTVGFLSSDDKKLTAIKQRPHTQKILQVVDSFETLKTKVRVPCKFKKMVRRSQKTTFIYPNQQSFRVINNASSHHDFIKKFKVMYSTSANLTTHKFDETFAKECVDVIVEDKNGFFEAASSQLIKFSCTKIKRLR
jgi:tRNA A37 threonylcarbamoyladenosine synthetase subunit TsaC/SUA5/YrdC